MDKNAFKDRVDKAKQVILITESDGEAGIAWDTKSLEEAEILLEKGLNYIRAEITSQKVEIIDRQRKLSELPIIGFNSRFNG